ncbi:hypothetical protein BZA70DRAFT_269569 [Myxozyma melibiosi]|uniref:DUF7719 domain-containing protein n=1 Tax=Myxozyma melibiosi TaxID=54550 RepID=A0ABR1EZB6_9ASCO
MSSAKPALKVTSANGAPVSFTDAAGNEVPITKILPDDVKAAMGSNPSTPPPSLKKKTVSFHEDTKPPSEDTPTRNGNAKIRRSSSSSSEPNEYAVLMLDYLMALIPLTTAYAIFDILVRKQYQEELLLETLPKRSLITFGVLFVLHSVIHPSHTKIGFQMLLMLAFVVLGAYLLTVVNEASYLQIISRAPPVGTLLVWLCVELEYYFSLSAIVTVLFVSYLVKV